MPPPAARHRFIANKTDNASLPKRHPKKMNEIGKRNKKILIESKTVQTSGHKSYPLVPSVDTAFKTFISARLCSAIWSYISDCDETFNYWEPLHYIISGHGLQTWEYSPEFALRSYTYLLLQGVPGWIYQKAFNPSPILIFYMIRFLLGFCCAILERYLYKSICQEFGIHIGRIWLIFQLFSVGMFISGTALLPSSFSMYFSCAALASWWQQKYSLAIFLTAVSSLLGWPFAVLLGVPIAIDLLLRKRMWKLFLNWSAISAATIAIPMILIDSSYFGKFTFAPWNLIVYNVFTSHGPNIFGTEPFSYYLINGILNYNIIWLLALITPIFLVIDYFIVPAKVKATLNLPHYLSLAPFYLWILVFFAQPHKEERFLFPIYPMISLCGAITVDIFQRIYFRIKSLIINIKQSSSGSHYLDHSMFIAITIMLISTLLGLSRVFAIYRNYHAPLDLLMELNQFKTTNEYKQNDIYNVCVGKDWYRYPGSFFLPSDNFRIRFIKSEFNGMLPVYFSDGENATQIVHPYFNDRNEADYRTYFDYEQCHFLIDFDSGQFTSIEPNYSMRTKEWSIVKSLPFLIQEKSNRILRAFYLPFFTDNYSNYGDFNLLKRKKINLN